MASLRISSLFLIFGLNLANCLTRQTEFIEYHPGQMSIVLSAPHGGYLEPEEIPDRIDGCLVDNQCIYEHDEACQTPECPATTVTDSYTIDLAQQISDTILDLTGYRPHLVFSNLKRTKLDPNREIGEAAQGNAMAIDAYNTYHSYLNQVSGQIGRGILFDIHGQNHGKNSSEIGILLSKSTLNAGNYDTSQSSIRTLGEDTGIPGNLLISGVESFGGLLEEQGFNAVPSPRQPYPGDDDYYSGGYITRTYGSIQGGLVDAIQIETPKELRFDDVMREKFAQGIAQAVVNFFNLYYT